MHDVTRAAAVVPVSHPRGVRARGARRASAASACGGNLLLERLRIQRRIDFDLRQPQREVRRCAGATRPKVDRWRAGRSESPRRRPSAVARRRRRSATRSPRAAGTRSLSPASPPPSRAAYDRPSVGASPTASPQPLTIGAQRVGRQARRRPAPRRSAAAAAPASTRPSRGSTSVPDRRSRRQHEHRPAERRAPLEPHARGRLEARVHPSAQLSRLGLARQRHRHRDRLDRCGTTRLASA